MQTKELTVNEKRMIQKSVKNKCANYDPKYGCLPMDSDCYMMKIGFKDSKLCRYYQNSILPIEPEVSNIFKKIKEEMKTCKMCGNKFFAYKNKKYCSEVCADKAKKASDTERTKRYRINRG